jgi:hypothetical protein
LPSGIFKTVFHNLKYLAILVYFDCYTNMHGKIFEEIKIFNEILLFSV